MNTRCPPKHVPSAARFFTRCELTVQPTQSYSVGGQRSSGQLTGKPAGARPDYRGRWCAVSRGHPGRPSPPSPRAMLGQLSAAPWKLPSTGGCGIAWIRTRDVQAIERILHSSERFYWMCHSGALKLAQGQDAQFRRFAVLEFETPEITEMVQKSTDGLAFGRSHIRVSFCAPGPPGRSMLAALIAAQTMALNRGKGLLPEPNLMQILSSLNNPTTLKLLMNPLLQAPPGRKHGILGAAPTVPFLGNPALSGVLLQLLLQNQNQLQQSLVWTRLLQNKENQAVLSHPGIMGDSPHAVLPQQNVLQQGLAMLGDLAPAGLSPDVPSGPVKSPNTFYGRRGVPTDRESPTAMGEHHHPQANQPPALQGMGSPLLGSILGGMQQQSQSLSGDSGSALSGVSILGEPPKDLKIPQNPFLNIQSVFPSVGMQAVNSRPHPYRKKPGILGSMSNSRIAQNSHSDFAVPSSSRYQDNYAFGEYKQDSLSHVYQHHEPADPTAMRGYGHHRQKGPYRSSYSEHNQFGPSPVLPPPPFNPGSPSSYFNSGFKAGHQQSHLNKVNPSILFYKVTIRLHVYWDSSGFSMQAPMHSGKCSPAVKATGDG
ncbi:UNVERIFIED_CONTAM: hypothetical protein FKN15_058619 [Acipenser sinensis]